MSVELTLCADDYGFTEGVSRGILALAMEGRISAASAMTNMPDWSRAAQAWCDAAPPVDLGLHLTLTVGQPVGSMPQFAPAGILPPIREIMRRRAMPKGELVAEIGRQVDAFVRATGRRPDHVDGHQHVHMLPNIRQILFEALAEHGLGAVPLRNSADRPWRIIARGGALTKALGVAALGRGFRGAANRAGHPCNDGFAGFSTFDPAADMDRQFGRFLRSPGSSHLVMCHPGHVDAALVALDPVTDAREVELRYLSSPGWGRRLTSGDVRLVRSRAALSPP